MFCQSYLYSFAQSSFAKKAAVPISRMLLFLLDSWGTCAVYRYKGRPLAFRCDTVVITMTSQSLQLGEIDHKWGR